MVGVTQTNVSGEADEKANLVRPRKRPNHHGDVGARVVEGLELLRDEGQGHREHEVVGELDLGDLYTESGQTLQGSFSVRGADTG